MDPLTLAALSKANAAIPATEKGAPGGVATLDADGLLPFASGPFMPGLSTPFLQLSVTAIGEYWSGPAGYKGINNTSWGAGGFIWFSPVFVPERSLTTHTALQCNIGDLSEPRSVRVGLYTNVDGIPNTKLAETGSIDMQVAAVKEAAWGASVVLEPGWYWLATLTETDSGSARWKSYYPSTGGYSSSQRLSIQLANFPYMAAVALPATIAPGDLSRADNAGGGAPFGGIKLVRP